MRHFIRSVSTMLFVLALAAGALAQAPAAAAPSGPPLALNADFKVVNRFPVPGEGNWDYISIDSAARRLYVSHGDLIQVLDADSGKLVGQVAAPGAHGVALVPELNRGFTSNGRDKSVTIFDTKTLQPVKTVKVEPGVDNIFYEPASKRVFALAEKATVLDAASGDVVGSIDFGGDSEGAVTDGKGTLYVALAKEGAIAVIDPKTLAITKRYPTEPCKSPHTLQWEATNQQLLVGCANNFVVMDATTGKLVTAGLQCAGVDAGAYDPESKLAFESCSEGVITIVKQMTPHNWRTIATIPTQMWAKTMAFDAKTKKIYLPTAQFEFFANADATKPPDRRWKPGTFTVLVVSR